jgi:hypothetical protein
MAGGDHSGRPSHDLLQEDTQESQMEFGPVFEARVAPRPESRPIECYGPEVRSQPLGERSHLVAAADGAESGQQENGLA